MRIRNFVIAAFIICCSGLYGQSRKSIVNIYFGLGSSQIVDINADEGTLSEVEHVDIRSSSSPDGSIDLNERLSQRRGEAAKQYLIEEIGLPDSIITVLSIGVDWDRFRERIEANDMPYREEVLDVIDNIPARNRDQYLREIQVGVPYSYMMKTLFPQFRSAELTIYHKDLEPKEEVAEVIPYSPPVTLPIETTEPTLIVQEPKALFAIKTNLLFDLFTMINLEVEVPIKREWSIAGEVVFPWWTMDNGKEDSRRNRLQLFNANLEGRYWWGDRYDKPILTGWFTGLYAGGGLYDLEYRAEGYQGEFFIAAGLSGGYAHLIGPRRKLRLEYSLGLGYISTNYDHYEACFCCSDRWHAVKQNSGRYSWFGPTKAKVSLSWLINYRR